MQFDSLLPFSGRGARALCGLLLGLALLGGTAAQAQTRAGEVQHLQGMATAQQSNGAVRFLVKGDAILEGDTLTTTEKGFAVVQLGDGSKITLRPATVFAVERFAQDQANEGAVLRLFKGGMRAISGLINRRNPGAMEVRTSTATIGIRGTSFDARLCGDDCRLEDNAALSHSKPATAVPPADSVVARVVSVRGEAAAVQTGKSPRRLVDGAPLYAGDEVKTAADGIAVIGFRDETRLSLNPETAFRITGFSYRNPNASDNIALQILRGGLRVFTGLIAKSDPKSMSLRTRLSTIGIRGTGMDISCEGPCAEDGPDTPTSATPAQGEGLFMVTWLGLTYFGPPASDLDIPLGQAGFVGTARVARLLDGVPAFMLNFAAPRPDGLSIDWQQLFGAIPASGEDGLYVFVRDGAVSLRTGRGVSELGIGETGFLGADGLPRRLEGVPRFMSDDPFPIPELFSQPETRILQMFGTTLGQPGQEICRL